MHVSVLSSVSVSRLDDQRSVQFALGLVPAVTRYKARTKAWPRLIPPSHATLDKGVSHRPSFDCGRQRLDKKVRLQWLATIQHMGLTESPGAFSPTDRQPAPEWTARLLVKRSVRRTDNGA